MPNPDNHKPWPHSFGVFVWDGDGDMGAAVVLGPFRTAAAAEHKADAVRREAERRMDEGYVNAMVVPIAPGSSSVRTAVTKAMR